jgi:hypothetical protein
MSSETEVPHVEPSGEAAGSKTYGEQFDELAARRAVGDDVRDEAWTMLELLRAWRIQRLNLADQALTADEAATENAMLDTLEEMALGM